MNENAPIRLAVVLARAGVAARRAADQMIKDGRVSVDGERVTDPATRVDPRAHTIAVDGKPVGRAEPLRYYALNKPRGVITAASDDRGRPTVSRFLPKNAGRCVPVGRLDYDSEGLLLLTNDGPLITALLHPSHELPRTYLVEVEGQIGDRKLERLYKGVMLDDGLARGNPRRSKRPGRPPHGADPGSSWFSITLHEGRKREVRRMCAAVGHPVITLRRTRFGPILLRGLAPGQIRPLDGKEIRQLRRMAAKGSAARDVAHY